MSTSTTQITGNVTITSSTLNATSNVYTFTTPTHKYYINGHEIVVEGSYNTDYLAIVFSMISLFGYKGYETLKSNGFTFDNKIEIQLKSIFRDEKIDNIIK